MHMEGVLSGLLVREHGHLVYEVSGILFWNGTANTGTRTTLPGLDWLRREKCKRKGVFSGPLVLEAWYLVPVREGNMAAESGYSSGVSPETAPKLVNRTFLSNLSFSLL